MTIGAPYDAVATLRIARRRGRLSGSDDNLDQMLTRADGDEDRLWSEMTTRFNRVPVAEMRVLLLGFEQAERTRLRNALRSLGVRATAAAPCVRQLPSIARMGLAFSYVIVNLDAYDSTEDAIDALLEFRRQARDIVLIAASAEVGDDDLSLERGTICDVTLRLPLTERRLLRCLVMGRENNQELQRRQRDLAQSSSRQKPI